jgi:Mg2+/Co2+ transporter CorB
MKQLKEFQVHDRNMGLVVDEYGEIQGLITIEDIFKEIVGKFGNESTSDPDTDFVKLKNDSILTNGNFKIRDINKALDWDINEENSKTINGLITEHLDFIPQANLCLQIEKYKYEILDIEDNFISRVKIKREA